jgi:predicted nucleotidyltransferase
MGSDSGHYFSSDIDDLRKKLRDSEQATEDAQYEAEVANVLAALLTEYNDRDTQAVNHHLDEIKKALEKELEGTVDLLFGGSVAKRTYVDGFSDIDSLVILDNCELANGSPDAAKKYFAKRLQERFPKTKVDVGKLAVTIRFSDAEIQLLPAISCRKDISIADRTGRNWSQIQPKKFTKVLTRTNQQTGNKVVPIVKLAKAIIANLPEKHQISGYHAESLAIEIFKGNTGELRPKAMLKYYFEQASRRVQEPIRDRTGQSIHVDDYLGAEGSLERRIVSDAFSRIYRRMNNADNASSIDEWHKLFGEQ